MDILGRYSQAPKSGKHKNINIQAHVQLTTSHGRYLLSR